MDKRKRELGPATPRMEAARRNHHKTVRERNKIIVAFGKHAGFEMHVCNVGDPGDWTHVLCVHTPAGQLHWRLSNDDLADLQKRLPAVKNDHYDGCKAAEKLERLDNLWEI